MVGCIHDTTADKMVAENIDPSAVMDQAAKVSFCRYG
jgi:hypothetical protein